MRPYLWDTWERSHSSFPDQYFEVYLPPQESTLPYNWTCTEILPPTHSHQQIHLVWMMENEDILKKEKIMWKVIPSKDSLDHGDLNSWSWYLQSALSLLLLDLWLRCLCLFCLMKHELNHLNSWRFSSLRKRWLHVTWRSSGKLHP